MTEELIIDKLTPVFREIFKDQELIVTRELAASDVQHWTSLTNTVMIHEVEETFGVKLNFREVIGLQNTGDLIDLLKSKIVSSL